MKADQFGALQWSVRREISNPATGQGGVVTFAGAFAQTRSRALFPNG